MKGNYEIKCLSVKRLGRYLQTGLWSLYGGWHAGHPHITVPLNDKVLQHTRDLATTPPPPLSRKFGFTQSYSRSYGGIVPVFIEFTGAYWIASSANRVWQCHWHESARTRAPYMHHSAPTIFGSWSMKYESIWIKYICDQIEDTYCLTGHLLSYFPQDSFQAVCTVGICKYFNQICLKYSVVLMSNVVGVKNKWNDMVEWGEIVATSEQWLRLVMHEGRRTEA